MSANETILHLPNGDFEVLHEEQLKDPKKRGRLLSLMLEEENFGRSFSWWQEHAAEFDLSRRTIRNTTAYRNYLRRQCEKMCMPAS